MTFANAVVIAHSSLYNVHIRRIFLQQVIQRACGAEVAVKIIGLGADYLAVKHRVNVIGAALKRTNVNTALRKSFQQCANNSRLSAAAVRARYHYPFHVRLAPLMINMGFSAFSIVLLPTFRVRVTAICDISQGIFALAKISTALLSVSRVTAVITILA